MKILVADDHTLFRETLEFYIQKVESAAEVKTARDLHEAIDVIEGDFKPDIVLLDMYMPGMSGLKGLKKVCENYPGVNVALLSGVATPQDVKVAMKSGARGFFPKTISGKVFVKGIKDIINGGIFMPIEHIMPSYYGDNAHTSGGLSDMQQDAFHAGATDIDLTPREKDVLMLLMNGASNKDIAKELNVRVVTVKLHVGSLFRKFGVKNRTQVVLKAQSMGFAVPV